MNAPNFTAVLADLQDIQDEREAAVAEAQENVRVAERRLNQAELAADMRTWSEEERSEWENAHFAVREAYTELRKAKAAL